MNILMTILTTLVVFATALALPGVIARVRARMAGRKGVKFIQHIHNVRTLLRKGSVTGYTTTALTKAAPSLYLAVAFTALLFVPLAGCRPLLHFDGDMVMFAYLLALGRFSLILAALDTGSSFEGMGASREALYGMVVEPALLILAGTLALVSGVTSFADMFAVLGSESMAAEMSIVLLIFVYVLVVVLMVECGRVPVDDPKTHLELTMIHEVMILDYTGVDLAMINIAGWFKMGAFALLAGNIIAAVAGGLWFIAPIAAVMIAAAVGVVESFVARNKLSRNVTFIFTVVAIAFVLFMVAFILRLNIKIG